VPTYEYRCEHCDENFDVMQSFQDEPLTACPTCGAPVKKVFTTPGIVFKGSGFYKTDSRDRKSRATEKSNGKSDGASTPAATGSKDGKPDTSTGGGSSSSNGGDAGGASTTHSTPASKTSSGE